MRTVEPIFNSIEFNTISGNLLTDHLPNFLIVNKTGTIIKDSVMFKRNHTKTNQEKIINEIQIIDWQFLINCDYNPNILFHIIYDELLGVIHKHAPSRKLTKKERKFNTKPWITTAVKTNSNKEYALCKIFEKQITI